MHRRRFLQGAAGSGIAATLSGCVTAKSSSSQLPLSPASLPLSLPEMAPINAYPDRIISTNVCTRPFRATGPRIETETVGNKTLIHN